MRCENCGTACQCEPKITVLNMDAALESVARVLGTTPEDLRSKKKHEPLAMKRKVGYYLLYGLCHNYSETARVLNKTHATAMAGIEIIKARMARSEGFAGWVRDKQREAGIVGEGKGFGEDMVEPATALSA